LYIAPYLGSRRLDKLTPRDARQWLNQLRQVCQCCAQGKDARRPEDKRRCCAVGRCCHRVAAPRTIKDARDTLRAALAHAVTEDELLSRNPAGMVRLPVPRSVKVRPWSVAEACAFLESARVDNDPLYTAFVLMLVLGLRRGEALGLLWSGEGAPFWVTARTASDSTPPNEFATSSSERRSKSLRSSRLVTYAFMLWSGNAR